MEFLILLAVIPVLGIFALVIWFLWLKPEPPVMDWKECVRREEAKQNREEMAKRVREKEDEDDLWDDPITSPAYSFLTCNLFHKDQ